MVAGRLQREGDSFSFVYGASYLARPDAISLYTPELPLRQGRILPLPELTAPGCIVDARPDSWGQRIIMNRLMGSAAKGADPAELGLLTYLLESGPDRIGALDFQTSSDTYMPRKVKEATLDQLLRAAELQDSGEPLPDSLERALSRGSSVGGARPKALLQDGERQLIAKFASVTDTWPAVQYEFVAMALAARAGIEVAPVELRSALNQPVLLVERFDRTPDECTRRSMVSALTILELDEMAARWASYFELAQALRQWGLDPERMLRELFSRVTFNILVGNTDDHARNQAAFWDGTALSLTPAYDISPMLRTGGEASQGMIIGDESDGFRLSQVAGCVERAHLYQLTQPEARQIVDRQIDVIDSQFDEVCEIAKLAQEPRARLRQVMPHRFALEGYVRSSQPSASRS
ncbi:MAG: type II toxin-antitoxin system HipA family toxin [Solirubrobacteraceae bacterium]